MASGKSRGGGVLPLAMNNNYLLTSFAAGHRISVSTGRKGVFPVFRWVCSAFGGRERKAVEVNE